MFHYRNPYCSLCHLVSVLAFFCCIRCGIGRKQIKLKQMGPLIFFGGGDVDSESTNGKLVIWDSNRGAPVTVDFRSGSHEIKPLLTPNIIPQTDGWKMSIFNMSPEAEVFP